MVITREFDAPIELVFKAFVDPDLYVQWLGARGFSMSLGGHSSWRRPDLI